MTHSFDDYLAFLDEMRIELSHLSDLERQKTAAVRNHDLTELDRIMKLEQAASLKFRGIEHKQGILLASLDLSGVPLSQQADQFPPDLRLKAKQAVEDLQVQYKLYHGSAEVARNTLECNLHEIDKILAGSAPEKGPGYTPPDPQLPSKMKTDFRA